MSVPCEWKEAGPDLFPSRMGRIFHILGLMCVSFPLTGLVERTLFHFALWLRVGELAEIEYACRT